jgi:hopanoid biosynthesis associated RND transporter like protein HpnN
MSPLPPPTSPSARLARLLVTHPWRVLIVGLALSLAAGVLAWARLGIETDRMALIGERHTFNRVYRELREVFGDLDAMVALIEAPSRAQAREAAEALAVNLQSSPRAFKVFHRVPPEAFRGKGLLFLSPTTLEGIEGRLRAGARPLAAFRRDGLGGFYRAAGELIAGLPGAAPASEGGLDPRDLSFLPRFVDGLEGALDGRTPDSPPWAAWIPPDALAGRDGSTWTGDGRLVVIVQPWRDDLEGSVAALRAALQDLQLAHSDVHTALTGEPVLEVDELITFRADARRATLISLLGVTLLLLLAMKRWLGPLLCLLAVGAAALCTLGVAAIWPGHLNLISLGLCALMIGLGIDYAVHWISRYDEERSRGRLGEEAVAAALSRTGMAIAAGSLTTALAFLATLFTEVEGIREFGVLAGAGVLLSLAANLILLPALVLVVDRGPGGRPRKPHSAWPRSRMAIGFDQLIERRPLVVLVGSGIAVALALGAAIGTGRLRYDPDLLALKSQDLPSVRLASEILHDPATSGMFAAAVVTDLEALREIEPQLRALGSVRTTASVLDVIPRHQARKLAALAKLRAGVTALPSSREVVSDPSAVAAGLLALAAGLEEAGSAALQAGRPQDAEAALALSERAEGVAARLQARHPQEASRLAAHSAWLHAQLEGALERLVSECARSPITLAELPPSLRDRLVGKGDKLLLRIYPRESVWKQGPLQRFVTEVQTIVPDAGGVPVQFYESDRLIRRGYLRAGQIALVFVIFYLVLHFRSVYRPLVATITLLTGAAWGAGLMALLDLPLNPANLLALPLTCGIGIDYAIHVIHRDLEARGVQSLAGAPSVLATSSGRAVWLSSLTTIMGFGALVFSSHRGVASIGWTVCLGVVGCLLSAALVCPALLRLAAGPSAPPTLRGLPGPKTEPGGGYRRPS